MSKALQAGHDAAAYTIAGFMQGWEEETPHWQREVAFIFMMGLRAQRDGWGGMEDAREYLNGVLHVAKAFDHGNR